MRVLLFDHHVSGHHIEYATYLARCLQEAGDDVGFVAWRRHPLLEPLERMGVLLYYAAPEAKGPVGSRSVTRLPQLAQAFAYALRVARRDQFDVVHHLYVDRGELPMTWALWRQKGCRAKVFTTLFWPYFIHNPKDGASVVKRQFHSLNQRVLTRMLARERLSGLFVHTEEIRRLLLRPSGNVMLEDRIHVVPDPATLPPTDLTRDQARRMLGLPLNQPLVLFFGGLRWDKGYDLLLRAAPLLGDEVGVVLAGEADLRATADVEQAKRNLRHPNQLLARLGRVDDEDVDRYFVAADLVALPYRGIYSGTSGVLQRAAGAGRPVLAADVGQIGHIVQHHGLGVVFPPDSPEALARAIADSLAQGHAWWEEVRARALEYAQSQDWKVFGSRVRAGYSSALNPGTEPEV